MNASSSALSSGRGRPAIEQDRPIEPSAPTTGATRARRSELPLPSSDRPREPVLTARRGGPRARPRPGPSAGRTRSGRARRGARRPPPLPAPCARCSVEWSRTRSGSRRRARRRRARALPRRPSRRSASSRRAGGRARRAGRAGADHAFVPRAGDRLAVFPVVHTGGRGQPAVALLAPSGSCAAWLKRTVTAGCCRSVTVPRGPAKTTANPAAWRARRLPVTEPEQRACPRPVPVFGGPPKQLRRTTVRPRRAADEKRDRCMRSARRDRQTCRAWETCSCKATADSLSQGAQKTARHGAACSTASTASTRREHLEGSLPSADRHQQGDEESRKAAKPPRESGVDTARVASKAHARATEAPDVSSTLLPDPSLGGFAA